MPDCEVRRVADTEITDPVMSALLDAKTAARAQLADLRATLQQVLDELDQLKGR
jgi:hypothetical protein